MRREELWNKMSIVKRKHIDDKMDIIYMLYNFDLTLSLLALLNLIMDACLWAWSTGAVMLDI